MVNTYFSRNRKIHEVINIDGAMFSKCSRAIGIIPSYKIMNGFSVTCKNCLRSK